MATLKSDSGGYAFTGYYSGTGTAWTNTIALRTASGSASTSNSTTVGTTTSDLYQYWTGSDFSIPATATPVGVKVSLNGKQTSIYGSSYDWARMRWNGGTTYTWSVTSTQATATFGGSSNMMGLSASQWWDIANANRKLYVWGQCSAALPASLFVYYAIPVLYYTVEEGGIILSAAAITGP